jgi:hypothetical protein
VACEAAEGRRLRRNGSALEGLEGQLAGEGRQLADLKLRLLRRGREEWTLRRGPAGPAAMAHRRDGVLSQDLAVVVAAWHLLIGTRPQLLWRLVLGLPPKQRRGRLLLPLRLEGATSNGRRRQMDGGAAKQARGNCGPRPLLRAQECATGRRDHLLLVQLEWRGHLELLATRTGCSSGSHAA